MANCMGPSGGGGFTIKAPAPAATPMQESERSILATARRITAFGSERMSPKDDDARDKSGSLSSSQIIEVLESVNCKCDLRDKLHLLASLNRLVHNNPAMCEQFFVPPVKTASTAWREATKIIEQVDEVDPAGAQIIKNVFSILCTVHSQVGIGVLNLRGLLGMMIKDGRWAPFSSYLLDALHAMVLTEAGPQFDDQTSSSTDGTNTTRLSANTGLQGGRGTSETSARRSKIFVFDGVQSGLFLGSFSLWPFEAGYAFETWVWPDDSIPGSGRLLLRIMASDTDASLARGRDARAHPVVEVLLHAETIIIITSQAGSKRSPLKCHATIPSRIGSHIAISHRKGGLLSRAECDVCINGHFSSYVLPFPKVSLSRGSAVKILVGCAQLDPAAERPHLYWERSSVALKPFKGLMSTVRFFTNPLTVSDMKALYAASCTGSVPCDLSHEARLLAQPHLAFPSLTVAQGSLLSDYNPLGNPDSG